MRPLIYFAICILGGLLSPTPTISPTSPLILVLIAPIVLCLSVLVWFGLLRRSFQALDGRKQRKLRRLSRLSSNSPWLRWMIGDLSRASARKQRKKLSELSELVSKAKAKKAARRR